MKCLALLLLLVVLAAPARAETRRLLTMNLGSPQWRFGSSGPWEGHLDIRKLYQINHPWVASQSGAFGQLTGQVTVPADWRGPIKLRFFHGDNYEAANYEERQQVTWFNDCVFIGHRFKQVLVNGAVVWEADAADVGAGSYQVVELPAWVKPGQGFTLALRMMDKTASTEALPGDSTHPAENDARRTDASLYQRFETRSYWGDLALYDGSLTDAAAAKATAWDWLAGAEPVNAGARADLGFAPPGPIHLRLETRKGVPLPMLGFPVRSGVPFAQGMLQPGDAVALRDRFGKPVPVQTGVLTHWKDGSVKWLLLDFIAHPADAEGAYTVVWRDSQPAALPQAPSLRHTDEGLVVDTGAIRFTVVGHKQLGDALLANITGPDGKQLGRALTGSLTCRIQPAEGAATQQTRKSFVAVPERTTVESAGPIRVTIRTDGKLVAADGAQLGRVVVRVEAWVGLPYVRVAYRVFNDTGENRRLDLSRLTLVAGEGAPWGDAKPVMATSVDPRVAGPAGVIARPGFGVGLRRFWQQFPKAMLPGERSLEIDLYHPIDPESVHGWFATGEAKRHELLICAGPLQSDNDAALAAFDDPPRLFDKHWHTQSGGWGPAMWRGGSQFAAHQEQMGRASRYSPATTVSGEYGVRNYGDQRYGAAADDTWFDNYYDPLHSLFGEYLMSGQRAWFPRAEAMCQHLMDVDIIHASVTHPERVGGINGYTSSHHNVGSYVHTYCLSPKGYLDYYHLTGDPDAREAALGLGEYVRRAGTGKGARSVREQAWPLTALMSVYRETWDPALLSVARTLFEDCMVPLDPRRGAYAEWHGSWNYVGTIPWMSGQMMEDFALYYWATGDRRAAERLVGLANALYCENMGGPTALPLGQPPTRGQVGVTTYSPNPFLANWSAGYVFLTNTGWAYAADLTGRREFIAAMRNGYDVAAEQRAIGFGTYWQAPVLLYYLHYFSNK